MDLASEAGTGIPRSAKGNARGPGSVVVTGCGSGIGWAIAAELIGNGYRVVGVDRDRDALDAAADALQVEPLLGDITEWDAHERAADLGDAGEDLVGWVNNAGVEWVGAGHEIDAEHIDRGLQVLLNGALYGMCVAVRRMLPRRCGAILNLGSVQGSVGFPRYPVYAAAKAGVAMATRQMAGDYAPFGIRVNAILPGVIDTPMAHEPLESGIDPAVAIQRESELAPIMRPGEPSEVAAAAAFLLSDRSSFITGATLAVDGGMTARASAFPPLDLE